MNFASFAPLIAEMTWDCHCWKFARVNFSLGGQKPREGTTDSAEEEAMVKLMDEPSSDYHVKVEGKRDAFGSRCMLIM
jgi:hypothetical protein